MTDQQSPKDHKGYTWKAGSANAKKVRQQIGGEPPASMSFGAALEALKRGAQVARAGWIGKGMFLTIVDGGDWSAAVDCDFPDGGRNLSFIGMNTAENGFAPWAICHADLLANDWRVVDAVLDTLDAEDVVERMAFALWNEVDLQCGGKPFPVDSDGEQWAQSSDGVRARYRDVVRAVLAAARGVERDNL